MVRKDFRHDGMARSCQNLFKEGSLSPVAEITKTITMRSLNYLSGTFYLCVIMSSGISLPLALHLLTRMPSPRWTFFYDIMLVFLVSDSGHQNLAHFLPTGLHILSVTIPAFLDSSRFLIRISGLISLIS